MGFNDRIQQADGITVSLSCGLCGESATESHICGKRYLRNPAIVRVRCLADSDSNDPLDLFLVQSDYGEEYTVTRQILNNSNHYEEL